VWGTGSHSFRSVEAGLRDCAGIEGRGSEGRLEGCVEESKAGWEGGRSGQAVGDTRHKDGWQGVGEGRVEVRVESSWTGCRRGREV
jgi:hypothetical protein